MADFANGTDLPADLQERYNTKANKSVNYKVALKRAWKRTSQGISEAPNADGTGKYYVCNVEFDLGANGGASAEGALWPTHVNSRTVNPKVDLTTLHAQKAFSSKFQAQTRAGIASWVKAVEDATEKVEKIMELNMDRLLAGATHASQGTITAISGSGPYTITMDTSDDKFVGRRITTGRTLVFGAVSGGVATVDTAKHTLTVGAVNIGARSFVATIAATASAAPTVGQHVFFVSGEGNLNEANKGFIGLDSICSDTTSNVQGVNVTDYPEWLPTRIDNGGSAIAVETVYRAIQEVESATDHGPDTFYTNGVIARGLWKDLAAQYDISPESPDNLKAPNYRIQSWEGRYWVVDPRAKQNTIRFWNSNSLHMNEDPRGVHYEKQGGDMLLLSGRRSVREMVLTYHGQSFTTDRRACGEIYDIQQNTDY